MTKTARPGPPKSLEAAGKRAWKALVSDLPAGWELTARESELLRNACRQADLVADLEAALAAEGVIVVGAAGQHRLNAVATELRQSRIALARLLGEIPLPDDEGEKPTTNASHRGQKAAEARWKKQGRRGPPNA